METDETVENWLPWKPVWESVGPSHRAGPRAVGTVLVHAAWDCRDSWMLQSRAEPHCIPQMGYQGAKLE